MSRSQCSSPGTTQISELHSRLTQAVRPRREWKQRPPFSSGVVTGICWSPQSGLKGATPPVEFGERSRDCALGHGGNEGPHLGITGESRGFSRAAAPVWGFSRHTTPGSVSLSWGTREVGSLCEWRGGRVIALESLLGNRASGRVEEGLSRSLSGGGRKPTVPSTCAGDLRELLMVLLRSQGNCGGGRGLSGVHWGWCIGRGPHLQLRQELQGSSNFRLRTQGPCRLGTGE